MFSTPLTSLVVLALGATQVVNAATALQKRVTCATGQTTSNAACCFLFPIVDKIQSDLFDGGECGEEAHSALRLAFHDAIGFSTNGGKGGGADGSILAFNKTETAYHANGGIDDVTARQFPVWQETGLSAGDFVHLAAAIGTANCAGAPRLRFLFGRPPPVAAAPDLTVPEPTDSVDAILARMADAGFSANDLVSLLSSHTIAAADVVDPTIPGTPFDSTVSTFDTQFFLEVLLKGSLFPGADGANPGEVLSPIAGEMRLQSDFAISQDPRTACTWVSMVNNQQLMQNNFFNAMERLQILGQDLSKLTECDEVVPVPKTFTQAIKFPPTFGFTDVQSNCTHLRIPTLGTAPGPAITLTPVPGS